MATAIVSVMTGIPVRRDVAMTGEITLRGRVWGQLISVFCPKSDPNCPRILGLIPAHLRRIISLPAWGAFTMMGNAMNNHKFKVGQRVNYTSRSIGTLNTNAIFKITQLLPPEGDEFQYRIRSASEPHERVAKESQLDRAA